MDATPDSQPTTPPSAAAPAPPPPYPPYAYGPPPKQKGGVLTRVFGSMLASVLMLSIGLNIYFMIIFAAQVGGSAVREVTYQEGDPPYRVAIVPIQGMIDTDMAKFMRLAFDSLIENPPEALILRIDSGGGSVTASDQIWHHVERFRQTYPGKPVVASFGATAASGGYYVAMPADHIFMEQTGMTGSIGVMAQVPAVEGMIDMLGIEMNVLVADGSSEKDVANNLFEAWHDEEGNLTEAGKKNSIVLKRLLNSAYDRFLDVVRQGRPSLNESQLAEIATGRVFTSDEALAAGLVDQIGFVDQAIEYTIAQANIPAGIDPHVVVITEPTPLNLGSLLGASKSGVGISATVDLSSLNVDSINPQKLRSWVDELGMPRISYLMRLE